MKTLIFEGAGWADLEKEIGWWRMGALLSGVSGKRE